MADYVSTPNFLWKIENFTSIYTKVSSVIWIGSFRWKVRFSRFWDGETEKILLFLESDSALELLSNWQLNTRVSIVALNNASSYQSQTAKCRFDNKEKWCIWDGSARLIHDTMGGEKDVIFSIMISPIGDLEELFKSQNCIEEAKSESLCVKSLREDIGRLFNNEECSDFILKCGEKSFHVHKAVLSARSDYFSAMFRSKMKEAAEGRVEIKDIEPQILELVLHYMYTGDIPELSMKSLQKIYIAADKFNMEALKVKCYLLFIHNIVYCTEGDSGNGSKKDSSNKVEQTEIARNSEKKILKDLFMSSEWRSLSEEFPHKAQEMCRPYLLQM